MGLGLADINRLGAILDAVALLLLRGLEGGMPLEPFQQQVAGLFVLFFAQANAHQPGAQVELLIV